MKLSLTTQAGLLTASRTTGQLLNAVAGAVVVRFISQGDYGTFRQLYLMFATLVLVTDLGLSESLFYFLSRNPGSRKSLMLRSTCIVGVAQLAVGAAIVGFGPTLGGFFNNPDLPSYLGLLAVYIGLSAITRLWEVQLVAEQRVPLASLVTGGFEALKVGLMFASLAVAPSITGLMWALVLSTGLKFTCFLFFLARRVGSSAATEQSVPTGEQLSYAMALWAPGTLNILGIQAHQYIVGYFFTPFDYAIYAVACFQVPMLGVLGTSVGEVLLVRATEYRSEKKNREIGLVWNNAIRKALLLFMPIMAALMALALPLIVLLFTPRYSAAAPLFAVMMLALPFNALFPDAILRACAAMRAYTLFYVLRIGLGIGLGVAGVKLFGMWGAAISAPLSLALVRSMQMVALGRLLELPVTRLVPWRDLARIGTASLAAALPAAALALWLPTPAAALAGGMAAFGMVFLAAAMRLELVTREEVQKVFAELLGLFTRIRSQAKAPVAGTVRGDGIVETRK